MFAAVSATALMLTAPVFAQGTADQAKAMLTKAVAAVRSDKIAYFPPDPS
jgi:hypothetical protein